MVVQLSRAGRQGLAWEASVEPVQLLTPDGEVRDDAAVSLKITPELCRDFYRSMRLARRLDEEALALQRQGELGLWLMALGQEAAQVGSISAVRPSDYVFPSYREHAAALCRGIRPGELLAQWRGLRHSGWDSAHYRFNIYTLDLATQLLHATGYAMGVQRDGADEVVLAYFGDGSASQGDANEAFNWAAVTSAPVLFFCQNNQWAISTPAARQTGAPVYLRGAGFGLDTHLVDGNDVLAVYAVTRLAAEAVRAGHGPGLVEAVTYRMAGHSSSDDPGRYRSQSEVDLWRARDPIDRLHRLMVREDWAAPEFLAAVQQDCDDAAADLRRDCLTLPEPEVAELFDHVYVEESPLVAQERLRHLAYLATFDPDPA
jgi:2-oxoisovalerate dehydrogenase E1 component alpha subunit